MTGFEEYLKSKALSPATIKEIIREVNHLIDWMESRNQSSGGVRHADLVERIGSLKDHCQPSTLNSVINSWRHYFNHLKEVGEISCNPTAGLKMRNEVRKVRHYLSKEILEKLEESITTPITYRLTLSFILHQAADQGALKRLEVKQLNLEKGEVYLCGSNTSIARILPLHPRQLLPLYRYLETRHGGLGHHHQKCFSFTIDNHLKSLLKKLKKVAPEVKNIQQVRASVIRHWLEENNLREVQYRCGHRSIRATEKYLPKNQETLKNQLEINHPFG